MELSGHAPFIVFDDANIDKGYRYGNGMLSIEIMDKFVFPQADFIYTKVKRMHFTKSFVEKTKEIKNWKWPR